MAESVDAAEAVEEADPAEVAPGGGTVAGSVAVASGPAELGTVDVEAVVEVEVGAAAGWGAESSRPSAHHVRPAPRTPAATTAAITCGVRDRDGDGLGSG